VSEKVRARELAEEGRSRESTKEPPVKRSRGRPTKEEVHQRDKHGVINPVLAVLANGSKVTIRVTPKMLSDWRTAKEKRWKGMAFDILVKEQNGHVDWHEVGQKMVLIFVIYYPYYDFIISQE